MGCLIAYLEAGATSMAGITVGHASLSHAWDSAEQAQFGQIGQHLDAGAILEGRRQRPE